MRIKIGKWLATKLSAPTVPGSFQCPVRWKPSHHLHVLPPPLRLKEPLARTPWAGLKSGIMENWAECSASSSLDSLTGHGRQWQVEDLNLVMCLVQRLLSLLLVPVPTQALLAT